MFSTVRHVFKAFLVMALVWPAMSSAAISQQQVQALQLDVWRLRANFHMYTVMAGDVRYQQVLDRTIQDTSRTFQALASNAESDAEQALVRDIRPLWSELETAAGNNSIAEQGYADSYATQDVNSFSARISRLLREYDAAASEPGEDLMAMAVYMQRIASEYLALAADPGGGAGGTTSEDRLDFREAVPAFDQMVNDAVQRYRGDDATGRALEDVQAKWQFIRESLVKFYENAVPFLVHRYTQEMVSGLKSSAERQREA